MNINTTTESSTLRITPNNNQQTQQTTAANTTSNNTTTNNNQTEVSTRTGPSSRVDLSEEAREKQAQEQQASSADSSKGANSLVSQIQEKIKELKEKIAEKKAEIEKLKNNNNLNETVKKQRLEKLNGELSQLTSALSDANANLLKAQQTPKQA